ncbi:MAG: HAMP domain-containing protein [Trueperaceae bacterium]|nr:HAMP domain-containing protein [Trueperaceae bacterium]
MKRLGTRLVLAFVGVTLVTVLLMSLPQLVAIARDNRQLPTSERSPLSAEQVGRAILFPRRWAPGGFIAVVTVPPWQASQERGQAQLQDGAQGAGSEHVAPGGPGASALTPGVTAAQAPVPGAVGTPASDGAAGAGSWVALGDLGAYMRGSLEARAATVIGTATLALALAVGLGLLLARIIARPIQRVAVAANSVAAGDLTARVPLAPSHQGSKDETVRLAQSFNAMADSLQRLERQRRDMVADVAHELRTPLTVLRGRMEALEDGVAPLTLVEVGDMHSQVLVLTRLVEDLRVLSLADSGKLTLHPRELDLTELARSAAAGYRVRAAEKGVGVEVTGEGRVAALLDGERMLQVLGNLLDNAVRYTPAGGRVAVGVERDGGDVVLEVSDTGVGFPEGTEARVFERFYRLDESRARDGGGSGLGLAIVKAIVEAHGGSVSAGRGASGGAVVRVVIPA